MQFIRVYYIEFPVRIRGFPYEIRDFPCGEVLSSARHSSVQQPSALHRGIGGPGGGERGKPQKTLQRPDRQYKAPKHFTKPTKICKDLVILDKTQTY